MAVWTPVRVLVVSLCFLLNMLDGTDVSILSFIAPVLANDWQIAPAALGVLFSASLVGMAIGCLVVAPLGDRVGRRSMIIAAMALVAAAMLCSSITRNLPELIAARLLVGVGVGTIGVVMTAMTAEYAPAPQANFAVGFVQAGWPLGAIITAFSAARLLATCSWQSLLVGIGAGSGLLFGVVFVLLPESLNFLALRRPRNALARINAGRARLRLHPLLDLPPTAAEAGRLRLPELFQGGRLVPGVLLWSAVTLTYFDLYFVISWIPKLAAQAGLPLTQAIYAGAAYNLGAFIGTTGAGWLAVRWRLNRVIAVFLALGAVSMLIFGGLRMPVWLTLGVAFGVGVFVQGGFNGFWALAAGLYPAEIRNTGIGWALGVGRIGAVLGPVVGGLLVGARFSLPAIFFIFAIPLSVAAFMTLRIEVSAA